MNCACDIQRGQNIRNHSHSLIKGQLAVGSQIKFTLHWDYFIFHIVYLFGTPKTRKARYKTFISAVTPTDHRACAAFLSPALLYLSCQNGTIINPPFCPCSAVQQRRDAQPKSSPLRTTKQDTESASAQTHTTPPPGLFPPAVASYTTQMVLKCVYPVEFSVALQARAPVGRGQAEGGRAPQQDTTPQWP